MFRKSLGCVAALHVVREGLGGEVFAVGLYVFRRGDEEAAFDVFEGSEVDVGETAVYDDFAVDRFEGIGGNTFYA